MFMNVETATIAIRAKIRSRAVRRSNPTTSPMTSSGTIDTPTTKAIAGAAIEETGIASAPAARTSTASSPTDVGFRRQSKPESAPTAASRVSASASVAVVTNVITATMASARNCPRKGSATIPPTIAAIASPGTPAPRSRPIVSSLSGSRAWANPRRIASAASQPPGLPASASPTAPAESAARASGALSEPTTPPATHKPSPTRGQRSPRRGPATRAAITPAATNAVSDAMLSVGG